ncbi:MAG: orotate phosphoribosyltransferase [Candidatus Omnitrophica bacterium]|nr:orotate phosphoribosyltransferase [Candidatus Omnitrophota bacterium]
MIEDILKSTGAIKTGHFLLASGLHSENYFQAQSMLQYPEYASQTGKEIAALWKNENIDVVVSLAIGGIIIGQEIAKHLGVRHVFLERKNNIFSLERGFRLAPGEKILLAEDVITTGGSLKEIFPLLKKLETDIIGITSIVLRSNAEFSVPFKFLHKINWPAYNPEECPLCKKGIPLYVPGTKQSKNSSE